MSSSYADDICFSGDGKNGNTNWKRGKVLGVGAFGKVFLASFESSQGHMELAVKRMKLTSEKIKISVERETQALTQLSHKRIVQYYGSCSADDAVYIFLEYMPGGTLRNLINKNGALAENKAKIITKQILSAVTYLHRNNFLHRDIKSDNILIYNKEIVKLSDFGLSKIFHGETCTSGIGTPRFMAPEMVRGNKYDEGVDVWAIGCVVLHMVTGYKPHKDLKEPQHIIFRLSKDKPESSPLAWLMKKSSGNITLSLVCSTFLQRTLKTDPKKRPSTSELCDHEFLKGCLFPSNTISKPNTSEEFDQDNFVPLKKLTMEFLPEIYRQDNVLELIKCLAELTVRIHVPYISLDRVQYWPGTNILYPKYDSRGSNAYLVGNGRICDITKNYDRSITCPCNECLSSNRSKRDVWNIKVFTANQIVYDSVEANRSRINFINDTDRKIKIWNKIRTEYKQDNPIIKRKYANRLVIVVSFPLGKGKQVSFGDFFGMEYKHLRNIEMLAMRIKHNASILSECVGTPVYIFGEDYFTCEYVYSKTVEEFNYSSFWAKEQSSKMSLFLWQKPCLG
ncbi:hypothetical protein Btru_040984 [Bulinus truncatus]|nr:hypothetical protein Btru_040984 [Bulinus truncatus]